MLQKLIEILKKCYKIYHNFLKQRRITYYLKHGQKPWSNGYSDFKWQLIERNINNGSLIGKFKNGSELSEFYGKNIDDRVVEYPWIALQLPESVGSLLDAGSALNFREILNHKKLANKKITIVNLNPEDNCFWQKGISYVFADLRALPFLDNYFDIITCISTLEHIGMDNTVFYSSDDKYQENRRLDYLKAVLELKRILKPGGMLFITVPFGKYQNFGFFQQFNQDMVKKITRVFRGTEYFISYYRYSKDGWNISSAEECKNAEYFDIHQTKYRNKNSNKDYDPDFAAASRAVACLKIIK